MHSTSKHALLRLVVSMTVAAAVAVAWAGTAFAAGTTTGTLEICKSSLNGMSGRTFSYSVNGGAPITVKGGRCSGPMSVTAGNVTILEAQSDPATDVAAIRTTPSARLVSSDLNARKAVVSVPVGTTAANETRVTFVNQPAGGNFGDLKICKLTETPAFLGKSFSFKVNGGNAISLEAGDAFADPSTYSCRLAGHFQVGTKVTVQELVPAEAEVAWIDTDPADRLIDFSTAAATADVEIGSGMTIVYFDNEAHTPQGNGWLEVCKDRALIDYGQWDWAVQGSFHFTIVDAAGATYERDVLVGQCSEPIEVAAGISRVTESARDGIDLVDVWTLPEDRLQGSNLLNRTADVEVPVSSDPNDETQLHFVNKAQRAQLKICKALGPNSWDLVGQPFFFDVDTGDHYELRRLFKITAGSTTQCKIWGDVTIGTEVNVDEIFAKELDSKAGLVKEDGLPSDDFIDTTGEGTITIRPGINTITIKNTAMGQLEVCKARIEYANPKALTDAAQPYIQFTVDGKKIPLVRAGRCSMPLRVTVGSHTVVEQSYQKAVNNLPSGWPISFGSAASDYELDQGGCITLPIVGTLCYTTPGNGIDVQPADQLVSKNLNTRTVTVNVRYGKYGETLVTYYNRIRKGRIKICKQIPYTSQDSLGGKPFTFDWRVDGQHGTVTLVPGECSFVLGESNIIDQNGDPTKATVTESAPGLGTFFLIDSISVQFGRSPGVRTGTWGETVTWDLGPDTNVVTYTNKSIDP